MAKKCCFRHWKKHLGGSEASETVRIFIETSLGTRLLTVIHRSATVADAKRKIALDHSQVFPGMGEVRIMNLQMQHQGHSYCLSESMTLAGAFGEPTVDKSLFAQASFCEHDEKVGILDEEVKTSSSLEAVDHRTGNVNSVPNHGRRCLLLLPAGREVSAGPGAGDRGRTAAPLAQFTIQEELLQDHLDNDDSGHVVQALQNDHPPGTDEDLAANPDIPEAGSKEISISHGTKKRKRAKKVISSVGEQSKSTDVDHTVNTDKYDNAVPQNEKDVSIVVEMDPSVSADLLVQNEATGNAGSVGPKKKRRKVERQNSSVVEQAATDHGLSSGPFEEVANEDPNPQITLTQDASPQALESVDVSGVLTQREYVEIVQNQEGTLPPSDACLNEERAADINGNVSKDDNGGADENLVAGQSEEIGIRGNRKEGKKRKTKRSLSSAAELTSEVEEQSHGAEGSGAPLMAIHEVGDKASQSMDVSVSVAPREGEEALQKQQEVPLPLVGVHPGQENTEGFDAKDGKDKKKKRKKSRSSAAELTSEIEEPSHGAEGSGAPLMAIHEVGDKASQSMDVSVSVTPREGEEALLKQQEVPLRLVGVHPGQENTEGLDAKDGKEKKKKKGKKSRSSAAKDIAATGGMKELCHGAEGLVASLVPMEEVGDKAAHSLDVSVSVAPSEGEEALQKQEALLPLVDVHPDQENTKELDGNAREVESATEDPVVTKPIVEDPGLDQLGRDQEKDSILMKEKKKRKKGQISTAQNLTNSEVMQQGHGAEEQAEVQIESNDLGPTSTEVPLNNRPETEISKLSKVAKSADDQIDFLKYFMPAKSQSEINSSVNLKGKGQRDPASTLSETQGSRKSPDAQEASDKKLEQSAGPKKVLPLNNKKLSKPSQDCSAAHISTLEKGKKPATASRVVEGPAVAIQNSKTAKQQQALNRNAMSTAGKGSNGRSLLKSSGKAKSLFNPERKLFTDSESESFSGENKTTNSDASTLPPSRSSSSSDSSSDSDSDASQDSIRKGTGTATETNNGAGKSVSSKKRFPSIGEMSMDDVIKSSRRFKKAKLTASQSQEPDSQA